VARPTIEGKVHVRANLHALYRATPSTKLVPSGKSGWARAHYVAGYARDQTHSMNFDLVFLY
jgi:hypothetical protein